MKTIKDNSGRTYKVSDKGTAYTEETPEEVIKAMEGIPRETRIKIYLGDRETGRDWHEEHETQGYIGRSTGTIKIPLLIYNNRSHGGGAILTDRILKIKTTAGRILYQTANYKAPQFEVIECKGLPGYTHSLKINGELYSNHKSERSANILKSKLS